MLIVLWLCEKSLMLRGYILLQHPCNDLLSPMKSFKLESFEGHMQHKYVFMYNATKLEQSRRNPYNEQFIEYSGIVILWSISCNM